jgi:transposase
MLGLFGGAGMNTGRTIFSQIIEHVPMHEFRRCVARYRGDHRTKTFSCWDQFLCMVFAQLAYRESLRDIVACLRAMSDRLYHMGIRGTISRSTLADANEGRDWRIYGDFAQVLIAQARSLYLNEDLGLDLDNTVYALDSTTIDLCISLFPWATYKSDQHAMKLHTLLDLRGNIPTVIRITPAQLHDVHFLDDILLEPGAFYVMDRGYLDFARLHRWTLAGAFFVTRAKKNFRFHRLISHEVDKTGGVICDQTISLHWFYSAKGYPDRLRRVRYRDPTTGKKLVFLTNNFSLPAQTIADLYRNRWQVELFFKWIKQHLRVKAFYGISQNAVKTQVWTAMCAYVLVAIVKKRRNLDMNLYAILQILSMTLFEKMPILQVLSESQRQIVEVEDHNQLKLFDL